MALGKVQEVTVNSEHLPIDRKVTECFGKGRFVLFKNMVSFKHGELHSVSLAWPLEHFQEF